MQATENPVIIHDLHATLLHLMGIDHQLLTFHYADRGFRLDDAYGDAVHGTIT